MHCMMWVVSTGGICEAMNPISDVLIALSRASVRYIVVGGVAAVMQGVERVTYDLDLVIELTPESCTKAIDTLLEIGYQAKIPADPHGFADSKIRESWVRDKNMMVFSFWDTTQRRAEVDIFVSYPLDFEEMWTEAVKISIEDQVIRLATPLHLVKMKRVAGRPKDIADIRALGFDVKADSDG
jgi:hypothetical protein